MLGLVALSVLAGIVLSSGVSARTSELSTLIGRTEPLAGASQDLYSALSEADAAAASAFLAGGLEPADLRERYTRSVTTASAALGTAASAGSNDAASTTSLRTLATELPVYTGLIEAARANNQQGFPVGAAYLREASGLMQSRLLPAAEQLYREYSTASAEQGRGAPVPWLGLTLAIVALVSLVVAQQYLRRRTRRTLNLGLLSASLAVVVAMAWAASVSLLGAARVDAGRTEGIEPLAVLAQSRILAQQARAQETLMLVAHNDSASFEKSFAAATDNLQRLLGDPRRAQTDSMTAALKAAQSWTQAHQRLSAANGSGDYAGAVAIALGNGPDDSGTQFTALDSALQSAITAARQIVRDKVSSARAVFAGLSPGVLMLCVAAGAAAAAGMWPRLREYQ